MRQSSTVSETENLAGLHSEGKSSGVGKPDLLPLSEEMPGFRVAERLAQAS